MRGSANNTAFELAKTARVFAQRAHRQPITIDELLHPPPPLAPIIDVGSILDPWNHAYRIVSPALRAAGDVDVVSAGPDGVFYTADDIGNWPQTPPDE